MLYWLHVCICLRLLVWNAGRWHVKKKYHLQKVGGPLPMSAISTAIEKKLTADPLDSVTTC